MIGSSGYPIAPINFCPYLQGGEGELSPQIFMFEETALKFLAKVIDGRLTSLRAKKGFIITSFLK